jgi:hypothetical protein
MSDRSLGIGDLGMVGLHIGAPARRTPLVRGPGELLSRTNSGSSARVDFRWRLELNTQDSDEDVLFRQEMRYPERGAPKQRTREMAPRGVLETGLEDRVSREEGSWSRDSRTVCRS